MGGSRETSGETKRAGQDGRNLADAGLLVMSALVVLDLFGPWYSVSLVAPTLGLSTNLTASGLAGPGRPFGFATLGLAAALAVLSAIALSTRLVHPGDTRSGWARVGPRVLGLVPRLQLGAGLCLLATVMVRALMHHQFLGWGSYAAVLLAGGAAAIGTSLALLSGDRVTAPASGP